MPNEMAMSEEETKIDDTLRDAIKAWPGTQVALADKAGVSESSISMFIHSKKGLGARKIISLCRVLGIDPVAVADAPRKEFKVPVRPSRHARMGNTITVPQNFVLYEEELEMVLDRRELGGDPLASLRLMVDEVSMAKEYIPQSDMITHSEVGLALGLLERTVKNYEERTKQILKQREKKSGSV